MFLDEQKVALRLKKLRKWLLNCVYPKPVINKSFFNAKLQGPANKPANSIATKQLIVHVCSFTIACSFKTETLLLMRCFARKRFSRF